METVAGGVADDGMRSPVVPQEKEQPVEQPVEQPAEQPVEQPVEQAVEQTMQSSEEPITAGQKKKRGPYKPRKPKEIVVAAAPAAEPSHAPQHLSGDFWLSLGRTLKAMREESKQKKYDPFVLAR